MTKQSSALRRLAAVLASVVALHACKSNDAGFSGASGVAKPGTPPSSPPAAPPPAQGGAGVAQPTTGSVDFGQTDTSVSTTSPPALPAVCRACYVAAHAAAQRQTGSYIFAAAFVTLPLLPGQQECQLFVESAAFPFPSTVTVGAGQSAQTAENQADQPWFQHALTVPCPCMCNDPVAQYSAAGGS